MEGNFPKEKLAESKNLRDPELGRVVSGNEEKMGVRWGRGAAGQG